MNNNVIKLVVGLGFFCIPIFGMEKEHTVISMLQANIYVEDDHGNYCRFQVINKDGICSAIDHLMSNAVTLSSKFTGGSLTKSQFGEYCIQVRDGYASHVALQREQNSNKFDQNLILKKSDFFVPIDLSNEQLKKVVQLRQGKKNVFVLDQYNARIYIESIDFDCKEIFEQLKRDYCLKQREDNKRSLREYQSYRNRRSAECCGQACACIICWSALWCIGAFLPSLDR